MTLPSVTCRNDYVGDGAHATYSYGFKIFLTSDLKVVTRLAASPYTETTLTLTTDYTVAGAGELAGGTVTLVAGNLASGNLISIIRNRPNTQLTDIRNQGAFYPSVHEDEFDILEMQIQRLNEQMGRALKVPETEPGTTPATTLPSAAARANTAIGFNGSGNMSSASPLVSPLTVKGDTLGYNGSALTRIPVGAIDQTIIASPTNANGVAWSDKFWVPQKYRKYMALQAIQSGSVGFIGWSNATGVTGESFSSETGGNFTKYTTSTGLNNHVGQELQNGNGSMVSMNSLPALWFRIKTGALSTDIQNVRLWYLLGDSGSHATNQSPDLDLLGINFDTSLGHSTWQCYTATLGGTHSRLDSGVTVAADTIYTFGIVATSLTTIDFYVNDVYIGTKSSNLPGTVNAAMVWFHSITNLNAGTTRASKFAHMICTCD